MIQNTKQKRNRFLTSRSLLMILTVLVPLILISASLVNAKPLAQTMAQVTGRVVAPNGSPISASSHICLYHINPNSPSGEFDWGHCGDSNLDGAFTLTLPDNFPGGDFTMVANPPTPNPNGFFDSVPVTFNISNNPLPSTPIDKGDVKLTIASVTGTVTDPSGTPVAEAWLRIVKKGSNGEILREMEAHFTSASYALGGLEDGVYEIIAEAGPTSPFFNSNPTTVTIAPNSQYDPINTQVVDLALTPPNLQVWVTDLIGNPISATVRLWGGANTMTQSGLSTPNRGAGFGNLAPGEPYWIEAWPIGNDVINLANSGVSQVVYDGTNPLSETLVLRLPDLVGQVLSPEGGPVPPLFDETGAQIIGSIADVTLESLDPNNPGGLVAQTNSDGQFSFAFSSGEYILQAHPTYGLMDNYWYSQSMPEIVGAGSGTIVITSQIKFTYPSFVGQVWDEYGFPIPGCTTVWLKDPNNTVVAEQYICGNDIYMFSAIPAGNYVLVVEGLPGQFPPPPIPVSVAPGSQYIHDEIQWFDIYLEGDSAPNVAGQVTYPNGTPVDGGVLVELLDASGNPIQRREINQNGSFAFGGLNAGDYTVEFFLGFYLEQNWSPPQPQTFTLLSPDDQIYLDNLILRVLQQNKQVVGTVLDQNGNPVSGAEVQAHRVDGTGFNKALVDPNTGDYNLSLGSGGLWDLQVSHQPDDESPWYRTDASFDWVEFSLNPTEVESRTIDLGVESFDSGGFKLTGVISMPNNSAIPAGKVRANLCNETGQCFGNDVAADGTFMIMAPPDFYDFHVWVARELDLQPPRPNNFPVDLTFADVDFLAPGEVGYLVLRDPSDTSIGGKISGQVALTTGEGVSNVEIIAFNEYDFKVTQTLSDGTYYLYLSEGDWHAHINLTPEQEEDYIVLPPDVHGGDLEVGQVISDVNFTLAEPDATISGRLVDFATTAVLTDVEASVFAQRCITKDDCTPPIRTQVNNGNFQLNVLGGYTYTVGAHPHGNGYMAGPPFRIFVPASGTVNVNAKLIEARTQIIGTVVDQNGNPVHIDAFVEAQTKASNYGSDFDGSFFSGNELWAEKTPYIYRLNVPTPDNSTGTVTWTVKLNVPLETGYVPAPRKYVVPINPGQTIITQVLHVRELTTTITGSVRAGNNGVPYIFVEAEGVDGTPTEGHFFHTETNADGNFRIPVLPGEYTVRALVSPEDIGNNFPPRPEHWNSDTPNPILLVFRPRPTGEGALSIEGNVALRTLTGTIELPPNAPVRVSAWSEEAGFVEGTFAGGHYSLPVISNTTWYVWAAFEIPSANKFFESNEIEVNVGEATVTGQNLLLHLSDLDLPDAVCETVDPASFTRISMPARPGLPEPLLEIQAGTMSLTDTVEVCVTPKRDLPRGQHVVGFGYEIEARDSSGTLIESNFNKDVRFIFYHSQDDIDSLNLDDPATLENIMAPRFYSTARQEWVELDDVFVDLDDFFITGKANHFSSFGAFATPNSTLTSTTTYSIYLPIVVKPTS